MTSMRLEDGGGIDAAVAADGSGDSRQQRTGSVRFMRVILRHQRQAREGSARRGSAAELAAECSTV